MDGIRMIDHWRKVRAGLIDTIDKFSDEDLDFKPFNGSWTVRELILHIPYEEQVEFAYGIARELPDFPKEYPPEDYPTLDSIKDLLASVHAGTESYLSKQRESDLYCEVSTPWGTRQVLLDMFQHIIDHEIHHRGELSLILGMRGKTGLDA
jgi:uncharacterized damage-inducible protein DinB